MRIATIATLGVASALALACSESPSSAPTDPAINVRFAQTEGPCTSATSKLAKAQLMDLLAGATLKQAQAYWAAVESACTVGNPDAANGPLMVYVNYLRGLYPNYFVTSRAGTKSLLFVGHIDTVFSYVGYGAPGLTTTILESGIVQVILPTGGTREYGLAHLGAFKLPEQNPITDPNPGDPRGHLFAMYALNAACLSVDNLRQLPLQGTGVSCAEVKSFPVVAPRFSPGIKVGVCVLATVRASAGALSLGHELGGPSPRTEIAGQLNYPDLATCHPSESAGSWTGGPTEVLKRLAWIGKSTFGVRTAYATDAGLGGIGGFLSPFGALDALICAASFNVPPNAVGALPDLVNGNCPFTYNLASPGSILVQSSLGQYTGPLVVLSQGGGNCTNCGGLELKAHFYSASGSPADDGVYDVNWISVQASPSVKGAPFVIRDGAGCEVARLTYVTTNSQNQLLYNGAVVSSWVRNVSQTFKIRVDLDNNQTRLFIGPDAIPLSYQGQNPVYTTSFVNKTAAGAVCEANDIASFAAEFSGIDSGVMGWDEIGVQRISDQPTPNY